MRFLVPTVAAAALPARSLSALVANRTGRINARITKVRQRFERGDVTIVAY